MIGACIKNGRKLPKPLKRSKLRANEHGALMHPPINLHSRQPVRPVMPHRRPAVRYLVFGVPYMVLFSLLSLYWLGSALWVLLSGPGSGPARDFVFFTGIAFAQLVYTAMAGFQCYRGRVSGVWMGLGHVVILSLFALVPLFLFGSPIAAFAALIMAPFLVVLFVLAVVELRKHSKRKALRKAGSAPGQLPGQTKNSA